MTDTLLRQKSAHSVSQSKEMRCKENLQRVSATACAELKQKAYQAPVSGFDNLRAVIRHIWNNI